MIDYTLVANGLQEKVMGKGLRREAPPSVSHPNSDNWTAACFSFATASSSANVMVFFSTFLRLLM
jgi:hypothetical protein